MPVSDDVLRLVRTVERLPSEDQDKILRMVDLLTLVPVDRCKPDAAHAARVARAATGHQARMRGRASTTCSRTSSAMQRLGVAEARLGAARSSSQRSTRCGRLESRLLGREPNGAGPRRRADSAAIARLSARSSGSGRRRRETTPRERRNGRAPPASRRAETPSMRAANAARPRRSSWHPLARQRLEDAHG